MHRQKYVGDFMYATCLGRCCWNNNRKRSPNSPNNLNNSHNARINKQTIQQTKINDMQVMHFKTQQ